MWYKENERMSHETENEGKLCGRLVFVVFQTTGKGFETSEV